jgi:acyl transferase domain-containing protein
MDQRSSGAPAAGALAIVGMAGRFPGAPDIGTFWTMLRDGVEAIRSLSDEELVAAGESPEAMSDPDYVRACGSLADVDKFDAAFFGMSARDAAVFDPQHRLFLECAWETFERAGHVGQRFPGRVAVFASSGASEYLMHNVAANRHIMETVGAWLVRHTGNDPNFLATRVSYELNLDGPSMNVQTACSSSLVAVHMACQSLLAGECDMALAGGATVDPRQGRGYFYRVGEILSPDGHCRAFDARSAGTVITSAVGCVLLRRLDDALRDGDNILAVIRGSAINNDGSDKVGYLAPSVTGQTRVISEALAIAGVEPEDLTYVECHGTGTLIGDPIELTALSNALRTGTDKKQYCAIASLKTNIGHTGETAGVAGLIKMVLALRHRQIPASLHYESPNPQIDFASSPFFVNTALREWTVPSERLRIGGVTSLGAGGTNVHVIVEEAPAPRPAAPARAHQLLVLSARTASALEHATKNLAAHLRSHGDVALADAAYTLLEGREAFPHRRAVVASTSALASAALEATDGRQTISHHRKEGPPSIVYMLPGGGAQYPGMGAHLYEREPAYREAFDTCLAFLEPSVRTQVRSLTLRREAQGAGQEVRREDAAAALESPSVGLPALFATEYAIARLMMSWGLVPAAIIGHSMGEYAAACLSGVLTTRDAVALVALRGRLFETLAEGGMLSVPLAESELRPLLGPELSIAAINGPKLCVASGPVAALERLEGALRELHLDSTRVHIRVAAHSAMLDPILEEFRRFCRTVAFKAPSIPFASNLTGTWIMEAEATDPEYWVRHLRGTVRFAEGVATVLEEVPRALIEVGPGRTLSNLARQNKTKPVVAVPTLRHPQEEADDSQFLLETVGRLWVCGVGLDAAALGGEDRRRVELPTYPFERERHWIDPDPRAAAVESRAVLRKQSDLRDWFHVPAWKVSAPRPKAPSGGKELTWLILTDETPFADKLIEALRARGGRFYLVGVSERPGWRSDGFFAVKPGRRRDYDFLTLSLREHAVVPDRIVSLWSCSAPSRVEQARQALRSLSGRGRLDDLDGYDEALAVNYYGLLFLAQAIAADSNGLRLYVVSTQAQAFGDAGRAQVRPERAVLQGACKVIPREYPDIACVNIDVEAPASRRDEDRLVNQLVREFEAEPSDREIVLRGGGRWTRTYEPVPIDPELAVEDKGLREGAVVVVTGGLGGIGLAVAEHLVDRVHARLVLVGRRPLVPAGSEEEWLRTRGPEEETSRKIARVQALRRRTEVITAAADVTDLEAMRGVLSEARARFGGIHAVFHAAGVLKDELIALRSTEAKSEVIDAKARGALVLDALLQRDTLDAFVLFSSVSSVLGLPGQSDYVAANAFLDAFAHARAASRPAELTLSVNWNAWENVGMLAALGRAENARSGAEPAGPAVRPSTRHPLLAEIESESADAIVFRTAWSRSRFWVLGEHVVQGGRALIPGTGVLEIARALRDHRPEPRAIELRDVVFLAPFVFEEDETRTLRARLDLVSGDFILFGRDQRETFAAGRAAYVDPPPPERVDLGEIRGRCRRQGALRDAFLDQRFMAFGPRWGNVTRIDLGDREALLELRLPPEFQADLEEYKLHPALLDMATGGAQALIAGFDPATSFFVPFSYGRVLLRRGLPAAVFSHVRLREGSSQDSAIFDAHLFDEQGVQVAVIEGFVMRRVAADFMSASAAAHAAGPASDRQRRVSPQPDALRMGMTAAEGVEALDRLLAARVGPQVVASTIDVQTWLAQLDADAKPSAPVREAAGARAEADPDFAGPRDDLERELAAIWSDLLGTPRIGIHDDFFELGGQSLIAVRLFHRVGKAVGVELPMATLFQAPTIAGCAELIRAHLGLPRFGESASVTPIASKPAAAFRAVVKVRAGGDLLPFFCVHGAHGNVLNFRDLSRALNPAQPFYGLQAHGVDGVTPLHDSIEDMAAAYLAEVREVQPAGPYLLGGYSGGGVVAFDMARRLTEMGETVALLALIDTPNPRMPIRQVTPMARLVGDGLRVRLQRITSGGVPYLVAAVRRKRDESRALAQKAAEEREIEELERRGEILPVALRSVQLRNNFERVFARYEPKPWPGHAVLFRAADVDFMFAHGGPNYGWDAFIQAGVDVVEVPGNHQTILLGANADQLVKSLGQAIETVQGSFVQTRRAS